MPTYSVDTAAVADTAARTRTRIATIQTEVDGMRGDIGLLQSCWTGTASDSMAACAADWHLTQIQVQSNLDQISLALDNAAVCYRRRRDLQPGPFRRLDAGSHASTGSRTGRGLGALGRLVGAADGEARSGPRRLSPQRERHTACPHRPSRPAQYGTGTDTTAGRPSRV